MEDKVEEHIKLSVSIIIIVILIGWRKQLKSKIGETLK